ncbi:MAG: hypothetical protein WC740_01000 [Verrucomicrobiia bacterium]
MAIEPTRPKKCPDCGSTDVIAGVKISMTAEVGSIGLSYKANMLLHGTEALCADMCQACGTVIRLYVKNPRRKWITG